MSRPRRIARLLSWPLAFVLALLIAFEELAWTPLARMAAALAAWLGLSRLESAIRRAPPRVAVALFFLPMLALLPVKLAALYFIEQGRLLAGTLVIVAAKLAGTAWGAWLYGLVQPVLMSLPWFARLHDRFVALRAAVYARVPLQAVLHRLRGPWGRWWRQRRARASTGKHR